jgi:hypothetical protein
VAPIAFTQNKLTHLETVVSSIEVENIRQQLNIWLDNKEYLNNRPLLVVLPKKRRPAFLENIANKDFDDF